MQRPTGAYILGTVTFKYPDESQLRSIQRRRRHMEFGKHSTPFTHYAAQGKSSVRREEKKGNSDQITKQKTPQVSVVLSSKLKLTGKQCARLFAIFGMVAALIGLLVLFTAH